MTSILKSMPIFKTLTAQQITRLEELVHEQEYSAGHVLFRQGDSADAFYIIKSGAVRIVRHEGSEAKELNVLRDGEFFGEIAVIEDSERTADAVMGEDSVLMDIKKAEFQRFLATNPTIAMMVMAVMAKRYKAVPTEGDSEEKGGQVVGIFSATGGSGNSLVTSNLAVALKKLTKQEVVLLDLDLMFGDQAGIFNVQSARSLADLHGEAEIDYQMVDDLIVRTASGVGLVQSPPKPEDAELVTPDLIKVVLELLAARWDFVLFDTANSIQDLAITLLEEIDRGFYILTPEFLSVKNAHRWLNIVELINIPTHNIELVLNKNTSSDRSFHEEIEKQLKKSFFATLPYDYETSRKSLNTAKPVVTAFSGSDLAEGLLGMAGNLAGIETGQTEEKSLWERLIGS